ncbi:hypothetical protein V490_08347 [Pseudogymnoascus sp. VKM F-3557]|nr:hypothetical protein V490_08347 [Pseudogymnoascus sp. VKM F-3557]
MLSSQSHSDLPVSTTSGALNTSPEKPVAVVALLILRVRLDALPQFGSRVLHLNAQVSLAVATEAAAALVDEEGYYGVGVVAGVLPAAGILVAGASAACESRRRHCENSGDDGSLELHVGELILRSCLMSKSISTQEIYTGTSNVLEIFGFHPTFQIPNHQHPTSLFLAQSDAFYNPLSSSTSAAILAEE